MVCFGGYNNMILIKLVALVCCLDHSYRASQNGRYGFVSLKFSNFKRCVSDILTSS